MPFKSIQNLLVSAIMPKVEVEEIVSIRWSTPLIRFIVDNVEFDYKKIYTDTKVSSLQFIFSAYLDNKKHESSEADIQYVLSVAERFVQEGADIDYYEAGERTLLHSSILFNQPKFLDMLLRNKADCTLPMISKRDQWNGLKPMELAILMEKKLPNQSREKIIEILELHDCKHHLETGI
jgi:hypothetical protein